MDKDKNKKMPIRIRIMQDDNIIEVIEGYEDENKFSVGGTIPNTVQRNGKNIIKDEFKIIKKTTEKSDIGIDVLLIDVVSTWPVN